MAHHGIQTREQIYHGTTVQATRPITFIGGDRTSKQPICEAQAKALQEIGEWARYHLDPFWNSGQRYFNDAIEWVEGAVRWAEDAS